MADNILKLRVESSEYDQKLKKAAEGIRHLAEVAHKGGGELTGLEKAELDYVKGLGSMETKSRTAAGSVRELESTYKELKVIYDQLNEVEKADEGGKALAASLDQIKQRAQEARAQLDNASKSLQENADAGKEDSSVLAQLASKFTVNIDALKLFDIGLQAAKAALDVAKDAFFASEATVDEWGRTMQSSQALYEGFLNSINNGDISGYLSRMDEIVRAARAAYDEMDKLNTMKTIQAPGISRQQTENERLRMMIQTGRYIAPADGRKATMQNGQVLTPDQIKNIERMLQGGMEKLTGLVKNEVNQTGNAINAYYDSLAKQNGMSLQEFKKGTSTWEEFDKKIKGYEEYKKWDREARTEFARQGGRGNVDFDKSNPYLEYKKWGTFRVDKMGENSFNELVGLIRQRDQQSSQIYSTMAQSYRTMNRAEGLTVRQIMGGGSGGSGGGGGTNTPTYADGSLADQQAEVQRLTKLWQESGEAVRDKYLQPLVDAEKKLQQMKDEMSMQKDMAMGKYSGQGAEDFRESMRDAKGVSTFSEDTKTPLLLDEKAMKVITDQIKEITKPTRKAEVSMTQQLGAIAGGMTNVVGGLENLGIEIPQGLKSILGGMQSLLSIVSGIATIVAAIQTIQTASLFKLAGGGVVHAANGWVRGNSYSGDNIPALLNAGELVLNKAQQGNLASQLSDGGLGNLYLETRVDAEDLIIMINNNGMRRGLGKFING